MADDDFANADDNIGLGFALVTAAGLSTALGAAAVYVNRLVQLASKPVLAAGLGFSSGVMLYVSFVEIIGKSSEAFMAHGHDEHDAVLGATLCFFAGVLSMKLISFVVHKIDHDHNCEAFPGTENIVGTDPQAKSTEGVVLEEKPADGRSVEDGDAPKDAVAANATPSTAASQPATGKDTALKRMGLNTALAIAIHNFPEGLATFVATLADPSIGATLAVAIAIHNIPEGLCVALPVYYASGNRHLGFLWALLSGISEPIGALVGYLIIKSTGEDLNQIVYGILFGLVGGMMVAIVIYELIPTAQRYDPSGKYANNAIILGMAAMAASLVMFLY